MLVCLRGDAQAGGMLERHDFGPGSSRCGADIYRNGLGAEQLGAVPYVTANGRVTPVAKYRADRVAASLTATQTMTLNDIRRLAWLEEKLRAGPLAAGYRDQRWTLARIRDLITAESGVEYTLPGVWYLLRRNGWSCQMGMRRAAERDEARVAAWKARTWDEAKRPRRPSAPGSSSRTRPASR